MRIKDLPKQLFTHDGEMFGTLATAGYEPFEFKGRTFKVRNCYYQGAGHMEGEQFHTQQAANIDLALIVDGYIHGGGKLTDVCKVHRGIYKRWKSNRRR